MKHRPLRLTPGSCYPDYGLTSVEVCRCNLCCIEDRDALLRDGFSLIACAPPITARCPFAGIIGLCIQCFRKHLPDSFPEWPYGSGDHSWLQDWTPPAFTQPIARQPLFVIRRGFCDDDRLVGAVQATWQRIPPEAQSSMRWYWRRPKKSSPGLAQGAMRIEALPHWPLKGRSLGQCWNGGYAIRIDAREVPTMTDEVLSTVLAHELGHAYQRASWEDRSRKWKFTEAEVNGVIADWGFDFGIVIDWMIGEERFEAKKGTRNRGSKRRVGAASVG